MVYLAVISAGLKEVVIFKSTGKVLLVLYLVRPVWAQSNRWKSATRPSSEKCIAKSKGVHREVESEESWRQSPGLTNRNHIRLQLGIRLPNMLNELGRELARRGHKFVRYADDCMIFCKSRKSAERTLGNIIPFIEGKLFLKVNRNKTGVAHISKVEYIRYAFTVILMEQFVLWKKYIPSCGNAIYIYSVTKGG